MAVVIIPGAAKLMDIWASNLMSIADEIRHIDIQDDAYSRNDFVSKLIKAQYISSFMEERFNRVIMAHYPFGIDSDENLDLNLLMNEDLRTRVDAIKRNAIEIFGDPNA